MATMVGGAVASHSTLMNTDFERVRDQAAALGFRQALENAKTHIAHLDPDVLLYIGSNHFRGFFLDLMPSFSVGVGKVIGCGEGGTPQGELPTHPELARFLLDQIVANNIDIAFSLNMTVDHGITYAVQHLSPSRSIPVIPIVINAFAPPLPSVSRCADLGRIIGAAIAKYPASTRVGVIGSGGLSHRLPWPDWRNPRSEDDRVLVEAWLNGRADWQRYEGDRRAIIRSAQSQISTDFDRAFLRAFEADAAPSLARTFADLDRQAGNGGAEIRNWIAAKAAVGSARVEVLGYWPVEEWLTGMGVATFGPS